MIFLNLTTFNFSVNGSSQQVLITKRSLVVPYIFESRSSTFTSSRNLIYFTPPNGFQPVYIYNSVITDASLFLNNISINRSDVSGACIVEAGISVICQAVGTQATAFSGTLYIFELPTI